MTTYKCTICGEDHKVIKAIEIPRPAKILEIPEAELKTRVQAIQNSFIIDGKVYLLQGDIFIYKKDVEQAFFSWSVWVSISLEDFKAKAVALKEGKNVGFAGQLETELPFYKKTKGLKVKTIVNINYDYAVIKIEEESELRKDQTNKISAERVLEIMQGFYHPSE